MKTKIKKLLQKPIQVLQKTSFKKKLLFLIILLGLIFFIRQIIISRQNEQIIYQTTQAEKGILVKSVSASGQVSSTNNTSITTQASGVVLAVEVKNGQAVQMGDKIAELELDLDGKLRSTQAWSNYQSALNNLESAKITLYTLDSAMWSAQQKFIKGAVDQGLTIYDPTYIQLNDDWQAAEDKYILQKKVVEQAQTNVNSSWLSYQQSSPVIYAPISGTVTGLSLQKGTVLVAQSNTSGSATSQKIGSIKTQAAIQLLVNVTEVDISDIALGNKVTITFDAFPDKTYTGKVISIDTIGVINSGVTSYPVVIGLDTEAPEIFPNMTVSVEIISKIKNDVILIPSTAITTTNNQSTVQVKKNNQITTVQVEIGDSNDSLTEIISGIQVGDEVVTSIISSSNSSQSNTSNITSPFSGLNRTSGTSRTRSSGTGGMQGPPGGF